MKKIYLALAAFAVLTFASCSRTNPYMGEGSFVTFNCDNTLTIGEDAGTFELPIRAIGEHGAFSVTVSGIDGTAKSNTHYKIVEPASGVLNFEAADTVKNIVVELYKIDGYVDPGKWNFQVNIDNATAGLSRGARRSVDVTITDSDHPLNAFIGTWTAHVVAHWGDEYDFNLIIQADDNDINKLWFYNLCAYMGSKGYRGPAYGTASEDLSTITIPKGQAVGYSNVVYWGIGATDIVVVDNGDGTISIPGGWGSNVGGTTSWYELYDGPVTFTRKQ